MGFLDKSANGLAKYLVLIYMFTVLSRVVLQRHRIKMSKYAGKRRCKVIESQDQPP